MDKRLSPRLQLLKIDNLLKYFTSISKNDADDKKSDLTILFEKLSATIVIKEEAIKKLLNQIKDGVSPIDIMILSIYYIEQIVKKGQINLRNNKYSIFWIVCMLSCKYILSYDYELELEYLANLGGFSIEDYAKLEGLILRDLDWSLWIPKEHYDRLTHIATQ
jgi:hypothetical protein